MIQFSTQDSKYRLRNKRKVQEWIRSVIKDEGFKPGTISYIFCSDEYLFQLNKQYLKHHTLTDIITFDYSDGGLISGDIFISIERVKDNANTLALSLDEEVGRVMAHGILHLVGYKDKSGGDKIKMTEMENKYLNTYPNL